MDAKMEPVELSLLQRHHKLPPAEAVLRRFAHVHRESLERIRRGLSLPEPEPEPAPAPAPVVPAREVARAAEPAPASIVVAPEAFEPEAETVEDLRPYGAAEASPDEKTAAMQAIADEATAVSMAAIEPEERTSVAMEAMDLSALERSVAEAEDLAFGDEKTSVMRSAIDMDALEKEAAEASAEAFGDERTAAMPAFRDEATVSMAALGDDVGFFRDEPTPVMEPLPPDDDRATLLEVPAVGHQEKGDWASQMLADLDVAEAPPASSEPEGPRTGRRGKKARTKR